MTKKSHLFIIPLALTIILLSSSILAQAKIEISTAKDIFEAGENITFKVSLFNEQNNLISDEVNVFIEDAEKRFKIEKTIQANTFTDVNLGDSATYGFWTINAEYKDNTATQIFSIEVNEIAEFYIDENILTIKNVGNTKYARTVQIAIGDVLGIKKPELDIGESVKYRLIAPDGVYNIKISDGKTTIERSNIQLTGNVVGILDETFEQRNLLTGGIKPGDLEDIPYNVFRTNPFVYIIIIVIFIAVGLITIERY